MDFLEAYGRYTALDWYPPNFHRAMGMVLVGLAVGRRVALIDGRWPIFPLSHYIMVADSGVGKGACVEVMYRVQREALPGLSVARKEGSPAGLLKRLPMADGRQTAPLLIEAAEATTMLNRQEYLSAMVPVLTELSDNNTYGKSLKDGHIDLADIQVSLILGTNEKALRERFSASIIEEGLASRLLWLTASWGPKPLDREAEDGEAASGAKAEAVAALRAVSGLQGQASLTSEAATWFRAWQEENDQTPPPERYLSGYWSRRYIHVLRAALIHALSAGRLEVHTPDLAAGWDWVRATEAQMFEAFGSLRLSSYGQSEEGVYEWLKRRGGGTWTEVCREWSGRLRGKESVRAVLASLEEAGRIKAGPTAKGGGVAYRVV